VTPKYLNSLISLLNASERLKVLLAEDEPLQRRMLERVLINEGYDVESVSDGEQALEKLLHGEFSILITDWEMPIMDGPKLCKHVRAAQLPGYLYILMLTEHSATDDLVLGLGAGANDFVSKPPKMPELFARLGSGRQIVQLMRSLKESNAQVQRLSITDELSQTYNRRHLEQELPREIDRSLRYDHPLSVVMADIDHFKRVNDQYGHRAGDQVILYFATLMGTATRHQVDWVARYGGEEFVLVLPETPLSAAAKVAETIRSRCAAEAPLIVTPEGPVSLSMTASFGVASLKRTSTGERIAVTLLEEADTMMYRSKEAGRNRVTVGSTENYSRTGSL
jgi:two-component system cell cycle response regulator